MRIVWYPLHLFIPEDNTSFRHEIPLKGLNMLTKTNSRHIISGFILTILIFLLIGGNGLPVQHDKCDFGHTISGGFSSKVESGYGIKINAPRLLEETEERFKTKDEPSSAQGYLPFDLAKNFNISFSTDAQISSALPPAVTIHSRPRYILLHALIIPS